MWKAIKDAWQWALLGLIVVGGTAPLWGLGIFMYGIYKHGGPWEPEDWNHLGTQTCQNIHDGREILIDWGHPETFIKSTGPKQCLNCRPWIEFVDQNSGWKMKLSRENEKNWVCETPSSGITTVG